MDSLKARIELERRMSQAVVGALLAAGHYLTTDLGDGPEASPTRDRVALEINIMAGDQDKIECWSGPDESTAEYRGFVLLIYGNSGFDAISDFSLSLERDIWFPLLLAEVLEENPLAGGACVTAERYSGPIVPACHRCKTAEGNNRFDRAEPLAARDLWGCSETATVGDHRLVTHWICKHCF